VARALASALSLRAAGPGRRAPRRPAVGSPGAP
jgi:hypothetical protein